MTHYTLDYQQLIHQRGFRVTPQRRLILDAICEKGGHLTPDEIYAQVHARFPGINRATVYRSLDFLCELHLVVAAQIGRRMYYEIASETPHHHLVCRQCNTIEQISQADVKSLFVKFEREHGFIVDMDHLTLFGLCRKCMGSKGRRRG